MTIKLRRILLLLFATLEIYGCVKQPKPPINSGKKISSNLLLVPIPSSQYRPGQLVDGDFGSVQSEPSRFWDVNESRLASEIDLNTNDRGQVFAFLNLIGIKKTALPNNKIEAIIRALRNESIKLKFKNAVVSSLVIEQVNRNPRALFIRRDYQQLKDAFQKDSDVHLITSIVTADSFELESSITTESLVQLNLLAGIDLKLKNGATYRITADPGVHPVVGVSFVSKAVRFVDLDEAIPSLRKVEYDLASLLGASRFEFGLTDHGLHNSGPYHCSARAELSQARDPVDRSSRNLDLSLSGSIVNRGVGGPAVGGISVRIKQIPSHHVLEIIPDSAKLFERKDQLTGGFAGLFLDGAATSSLLVSNVHIVNPHDGPSFFVFHNVKIVIYSD